MKLYCNVATRVRAGRAAIRVEAAVIVTYNLKDFPSDLLECFVIEAQSPDHFLHTLLNIAPSLDCHAEQSQRASVRNRARTAHELLATLESQGPKQSVARLREFAELL